MALSPKREHFAQEVANGKTLADAYRAAYKVSPTTKPDSIYQESSRLAADLKISARVDELKSQLASKQLWSREDSVRALLEVVTDGEVKHSDKTNAVKVLNEMHGYNAPMKVDVDGKITLQLTNTDADL